MPGVCGEMKICLCMIVKNEEHVIKRALDSVKSHIDSYVICDTGSTDRTKELIAESLAGIPGTIEDRPWQNFGANRTEGLEIARKKADSDYILIMDADDIFDAPADWKDDLKLDSYHAKIKVGATEYWQLRVLKTALPWQYVGAVHEYPTCAFGSQENGYLPEVKILSKADGSSWQDSKKYARHALILQNALLDDPGNSRSWFYLGQSLRDAKDYDGAIRAYQQRIDIGGWQDEVWFAAYQIGRCHEMAGRINAATHQYLLAYQYNPQRAEPLYELARMFLAINQFDSAYMFASKAREIPHPTSGIFVLDFVYLWGVADVMSVAAYYLGKKDESLALCEEALLAEMPDGDRKRIQTNRDAARSL